MNFHIIDDAPPTGNRPFGHVTSFSAYVGRAELLLPIAREGGWGMGVLTWGCPHLGVSSPPFAENLNNL